MKKMHLIGLLIIAASIGWILTQSKKEFSEYANFSQARMNAPKEFHVVGRLNKAKAQTYDPVTDANLFKFFMVDEQGLESLVVYKGAKPDGFDQTEKIVVAGNYKNDHFSASQILMKCPSKYIDENKMKES